MGKTKTTCIIIGLILVLALFFGCTANNTTTKEGLFAAQENTTSDSKITLSVNIPCQGHAGLIKGELKKVSGITSVAFTAPNIFTVNFDSAKTSKEQILGIDVFKEYPAKLA